MYHFHLTHRKRNPVVPCRELTKKLSPRFTPPKKDARAPPRRQAGQWVDHAQQPAPGWALPFWGCKSKQALALLAWTFCRDTGKEARMTGAPAPGGESSQSLVRKSSASLVCSEGGLAIASKTQPCSSSALCSLRS